MSACKVTRKSAAAHNGYSSMNCLPTLDGYQFTAGQGTDQIQSRIENSRVKLNLVSKPGSISLNFTQTLAFLLFTVANLRFQPSC